MPEPSDQPRTCLHCGYITEHLTSDRCPECGTPVAHELRTCLQCGYITEHITSGRCPECGVSVTDGRAPRPEPLLALLGVTILNCTAGWLSLAFPLGGQPTNEPIIMTTWLVSAILCGTWILIDFGRGRSSLTKSEGTVLALSALQFTGQLVLLF